MDEMDEESAIEPWSDYEGDEKGEDDGQGDLERHLDRQPVARGTESEGRQGDKADARTMAHICGYIRGQSWGG